MTKGSPIIEFAEDLPLWIRVRDVILTIIVWLMYFYFMRDFFAFTGDTVRWTFHGFHDTGSYTSFQILRAFASYIEVIILTEIIFVCWSLYNLLRFGRDRGRRRTSLAVKDEEIAKMYKVDPKDVAQWHQSRTMIMHHDAKGRLANVETQ